MEHHSIDLLAIQETECLGQPQDQLITNSKGKSYRYIHTGERKGVGFLIAPSLCSPAYTTEFRIVNPRILHLTISSGKTTTSFLLSHRHEPELNHKSQKHLLLYKGRRIHREQNHALNNASVSNPWGFQLHTHTEASSSPPHRTVCPSTK